MLVTDGEISRLANELHPLNAASPMLVTDDGIVTLANELQHKKALSPMLVTDDGISKLANELHPSKACSPMLSTDGHGIATRTNALQPLNAPASMRVTEDGRATTNGFFLSTSPHAFDMERVMVGVPCGTSICSGVLLLYCPRTGPRAGNGGGMASLPPGFSQLLRRAFVKLFLTLRNAPAIDGIFEGKRVFLFKGGGFGWESRERGNLGSKCLCFVLFRGDGG